MWSLVWLNLLSSLIPIYFFNPSIFLAVVVSDGYVLWRWITFALGHNYGWAQVGVRFHIQHSFVINMAANSPWPCPTCTPAPCFSFTEDSVYAGCTLCACFGGVGEVWCVQSGSSWVGWSWWPTPARTSQLVQQGYKKQIMPGSLQKNRDACAQGTEAGQVSPDKTKSIKGEFL